MRLFSESAVLEWLGVPLETNENGPKEDCPIAMIVRVSSNGQARATGEAEKSSIEHQQERVEEYCMNRWGKLGKLYKSVGSGLNFERAAHIALISDILDGHYRGGFIVACSFDRICRFGIAMIERICEFGGCEIVYTMDEREAKDANETLVDDVLGVLCHFTAKASGAKAKKVLTVHLESDTLQEAYRMYRNGHGLPPF